MSSKSSGFLPIASRREFVSNDYRRGVKVLSAIEQELLHCDEFQISVAFITMGGIEPLLQTFRELERRRIPGKILTTDYLMFNDPNALNKLLSLKNIDLKLYRTDPERGGFHTKGYIFRSGELYRMIIGSSNLTQTAITKNQEWNTKAVGRRSREVIRSVLDAFDLLWGDPNSIPYAECREEYRSKYALAKKQHQIAVQEPVVQIRQYRLTPNKMQAAFTERLAEIAGNGESRALLISATGDRVIIVIRHRRPEDKRVLAA